MSATVVDVVQKMKFSAKVSGLKQGLAAAITIATVGTMKDHPGDNRIKLESKDNELIAVAFGGSLACQVSITNTTQDNLELKTSGEGYAVVNATDLQKCLSSFAEEERISVYGVSNEVMICRESDEEEKQVLPL